MTDKSGFKKLKRAGLFTLSLHFVLILFIVFMAPVSLAAQSYDLLIKDGHVIDPKNGINQPMDVAIKGNRIARIAADIPASGVGKVIVAKGLYVTPGLIDIHTHVFVGSTPGRFADGFSSVSPDDFSFRSGITTVVDAGTSGWRNFPKFKEQVIDPSETRVLAFLNIAGHGMRDSVHNHNLEDMNPQATASVARQYPDLIVGIKIGHFQDSVWTPFDRAVEAGRITGAPLLLECHLPEFSLSELLERMRPGDIFTHAFGQVNDRTSILDSRGIIRPYIAEAKEKGIVFDVGHGGGSFHYSQAISAMEQGLIPDTFGTDLHRYSMNDGMKNMLNIMSKYLNMGLSIEEVILRATWNAAQTIGREDLGHLSEGAVADLAILGITPGNFGFVDAGGYKIRGDQKLEAELTVRAGKVVWDLNGLSAELWGQ